MTTFERTNGGALINAVRENNSTINDTYLSSQRGSYQAKKVHYSPKEEQKKPAVSPYFERQVDFFLGKKPKKTTDTLQTTNNSFQIPSHQNQRGSSGSFKLDGGGVNLESKRSLIKN